MLKWIKRTLGFIVLLFVMFFVIGILISLLWSNVTDYLASWLNTVGVKETTDLLFDFTFGISLLISIIISVLCIRRHT